MSPTLRLARWRHALGVGLIFAFPIFTSRVPRKPYDWRRDWRNW